MNNFTRRFLTEWRRLGLAFAGKTFLAAVSGGADSVALLLVLNDLRARKKLENRFVVAHFNHNLRAEQSEADAEFVKSLCVKFDFEFALGTGDVARTGNLEQNARLARYGFLRKTAENVRADAVLTAHTINDQAETFLINLIRGSGLTGLSAMRPVRFLKRDEEMQSGRDEEMKSGRDKETKVGANLRLEFESPNLESENLNIESEIDNLQSGIRNPESGIDQSQIANRKSQIFLVRPLLRWAARADTENFCRAFDVEFRYDTMNEDLAFKRVRVRKVLLPLLEDFNPKIVETLAQTAELLRSELENGAKLEDRRPKTENRFLILKELKSLEKSTLYSVLREWLAHNRGNTRRLELKHIEAIERLIFSRKSGKTVELPNGEKIVKTEGKLLFAGKNDI